MFNTHKKIGSPKIKKITSPLSFLPFPLENGSSLWLLSPFSQSALPTGVGMGEVARPPVGHSSYPIMCSARSRLPSWLLANFSWSHASNGMGWPASTSTLSPWWRTKERPPYGDGFENRLDRDIYCGDFYHSYRHGNQRGWRRTELHMKTPKLCFFSFEVCPSRCQDHRHRQAIVFFGLF